MIRRMPETSSAKNGVCDSFSGAPVLKHEMDSPRMGAGNVSYIADRHSRPKQLNDQIGVHGEILPDPSKTVLCAATHKVQMAFLAVERMVADPRYTALAFAALDESRRALDEPENLHP